MPRRALAHALVLPTESGTDGTGSRTTTSTAPAAATRLARIRRSVTVAMSALLVPLVVIFALIWAPTPSDAQLHKMPVDNLYKLFSSVEKEVNPELSLPVEGVVPAYVAGSLFKNGFGKFGMLLHAPSELQC